MHGISQVQKMKGFNAYYGCHYCFIKGIRDPKKIHVYYPVPDNVAELTLRKGKHLKAHARYVRHSVHVII